jgi:hypothetical protein
MGSQAKELMTLWRAVVIAKRRKLPSGRRASSSRRDHRPAHDHREGSALQGSIDRRLLLAVGGEWARTGELT